MRASQKSSVRHLAVFFAACLLLEAALWFAGRTWPVVVRWTMHIERDGSLREVATYGPHPLTTAAGYAIPLLALCVTTVWLARSLGRRFAFNLRWVSWGTAAGAGIGLAFGAYVLALAAQPGPPTWLYLDVAGAEAAAWPMSHVLGRLLWQLGEPGFVVVAPTLNYALVGAVIGLVLTFCERRYRAAAA